MKRETLRFCNVIMKRNRSGYYAIVEHGYGGKVFQVYMDGTVLERTEQGLFQARQYSGELLSHIRYNGRRMLRYQGVENT